MKRQTLTKLAYYLKKGRLAGFFVFCFLAGCKPIDPSSEQQLLLRAKTDATAAKHIARQRLATEELEAALHWWRLAAALGAEDALEHAVRLQLRLEGKLATAKWLERERPRLPALSNELLLAELGLWPAGQAEDQQGWQSTAGCALTLQPVVSQAQGERTWRGLQLGWQQDPQLSRLPVCFKPLLRVTSTALNCSERIGDRIHCDYQALTSLVLDGEFQQLVIVAGRGIASYNNGIVQLPENAELTLLRHEFMHIAGFIDEYLLAPATAKAICEVGRIAPNLLIGDDLATVNRYLQHYAVAADELQLTAVDTCNALGMQAYRPIAAINPMRHFEADLPDFYWRVLQQMLNQPERLMPVQYYFAYLARQEQAWLTWMQLMQRAAGFGYPAAISALEVDVGS